jgi:type I restriction enzyme M protein
MLDAETRRRIDSCRDILVGKVPDPKSQVEQITIALIYKFMDDMDAEAEELGGKRSFFAKAYAKYGWTKLMSPRLGGFEVLTLYSEAIATMTANPGIPALFRDIFKNAYLPYRDPETLKSFLKEIDGFSYDHSERLGDAFEYLLSVLGSQGDAGQFRTPRHIIDFMVEVIDPQKHESILDPACGTAGFLISAWKHILRHNSGKQALKPAERQRLAANIHGYDISPDMVRLSLVNMYLHGFSDPHIIEYDTLTSDERWNETADVILANPPFMSPKGGIKPHKRFSVQATRSEVLFVDYMAEHLSPQGRAAIIVPEGIIFQSGTAYRKLREMLVKNALVAVVSLPAGVFNPYAGVKTSILILDKRLAKTCDSVLFVKVENDGYNLGAQRRAVAGSDLTEAARVLRAWMDGKPDQESALATRVEKARIGENGEWNLSGERYQPTAKVLTSFATTTIGEVITSITPPAKLQKESYRTEGRYPIIDQSQEEIAGWTDDELAVVRPTKPLVVFGDHTCAIKLVRQPFVQGADGIKILETKDVLLPEFLFHFLKVSPLEADGYKRHFTDLKRKELPVPPLAIQQEIVAEIEGYQKVIDGARQVVENYQPRIAVQPDWPVVELGQFVTMSSGGTPSKQEASFWKGNIPWVSPKDMKVEFLVDTEDHISTTAISNSATKLVPNETLLCVVRSGILQHTFPVALTTRPMAFNQDIVAIQTKGDRLNIRYLFYVFRAKGNEILAGGIKPGVTVQSFHSGFFKSYPLALPDLETQRAIVAEIEAEQALVDASRQLIARFEAKIKTAINRVWSEA